jgi:hypothetical protein
MTPQDSAAATNLLNPLGLGRPSQTVIAAAAARPCEPRGSDAIFDSSIVHLKLPFIRGKRH